MTNAFNIPDQLIEAAMRVTWRRDLDLDPIVAKVINRVDVLQEVYIGNLNDHVMSSAYQDDIHSKLKIPSHNSELLRYMRNSTAVNDHLWKLYHSEVGLGDRPHYDEGCAKIASCLPIRDDLSGVKLYSGLHESPATTSAFKWNPTKEKKILHFLSFVSSTTNIGTAIGFARPDAESEHHESDHHGTILPKAMHIVEMSFGSMSQLGSIRHIVNLSEHEVLIGHGHDFELHHRPTLLNPGSMRPVYLWKATNGVMSWKRLELGGTPK